MGEYVFISYAREDDDFVLKLATELKDRGISVWLDQWDIPAGADWDQRYRQRPSRLRTISDRPLSRCGGIEAGAGRVADCIGRK